MTKKSDAKKDNPVLQRFVFGLDENGKPVGARFPNSETRVFEIVQARNLDFHQAYDDEWAAVGMQLPVGRVYSRGKAFIPSIKQALYDKLQATLARWKEDNERSQAERSAAAAATRESKNGAGKPPTNGSAAALVASGFPRSWEEIAPGHLVLGEESLEEGYWRAVVISRDKDILVLRYRDYPRAQLITRHISTIAILNPGPTT